MSSARQDFWGSIKASGKRRTNHRRKNDPYDDSDGEDAGKDIVESGPTAKYHYTALSDAEGCIRLLELQPGYPHDVIICRLDEITVDASVNQYDALSYVWGPPGDSTPIQVNDGSLEIGSNLYRALKNLRHADRPRYLWVDAICINQASIPERNVQMLLMREIYQNAACTVCFLGPKRRTTGVMYAMLEDLALEGRALETDASTNDVDKTLSAFVNDLPVRPAKTKLFEKYIGDTTIVDIAGCEWWHRAWTVQELMLSSNAVMVTGRHTITWEDLCTAVDHGLNIQIWGAIAFGFVMNPVVVPYISMRALMSQRQYRRPHQLESPAVDLLLLLMHCRHRKSTDARDKVYAVLGLLRDSHPEALNPENPDGLDVELGYSYDAVYVYRRMCQELIQKTGNLDVLGICPQTTRPLPSWATDWSITDNIGSPLMQDSLGRARTTHAAKHTRANAWFSDDGSRMIISGYELTSVVALAKTLPVPFLKNRAGVNTDPANLKAHFKTKPPDVEAMAPDFEAMAPDFEAMEPATPGIFSAFVAICKIFIALFIFLLKILMPFFIFVFKTIIEAFKLQYEWLANDLRELIRVFTTLFAWERFAGAQPPTNPGGAFDAVYWQTLCAGTYKNGSPEETEMLFKTWSDLLQPLRKFMQNHPKITEKYPLVAVAKYMRATWRSYGEFWPYIGCSQHRCLGRTANGWLCLLPNETDIGDVVILADGGRVPLIIRPRENGHVFVGEAYIHGIMDGQAFDAARCGDIELH